MLHIYTESMQPATGADIKNAELNGLALGKDNK